MALRMIATGGIDPATQQLLAAQNIGGAIGRFGQVRDQQLQQQALIDALAGELGPGGMGPPTQGLLPPGMDRRMIEAMVLGGGGDALLAAGLERQFPKPGEGFTLGPNEIRHDAAGQVIAQGPAAPELSNAQKEALALGFDLGTPEGAQGYAQWRQSLTRPPAAPTVNLPPQEREGQVLAARFVDQIETQQLPALRRQLNQVDQIEQLFDEGLATGRAAELVSGLSNLFGVEIDPNASRLEAARALVNGIIVQKIGEATFGALSEGERAFLGGITADTAITPEANRRRLGVARKMLRYEQSVQREASRYADERGTTAGLGGHLEGWAQQHPLVTEADLRRQASPARPGLVERGAETINDLIDRYADR